MARQEVIPAATSLTTAHGEIASAYKGVQPLAEVNWEPEIREFEQQDRTNPPPAGAVVFVGSSSIRF
jgi:hypothetical protein